MSARSYAHVIKSCFLTELKKIPAEQMLFCKFYYPIEDDRFDNVKSSNMPVNIRLEVLKASKLNLLIKKKPITNLHLSFRGELKQDFQQNNFYRGKLLNHVILDVTLLAVLH